MDETRLEDLIIIGLARRAARGHCPDSWPRCTWHSCARRGQRDHPGRPYPEREDWLTARYLA